MSRERWLALYFPDLPLAVFSRGLGSDWPLAVSDQQGGREQVVRCNAAALQQGINPGMALTTALSLDAGLLLHARDREREQQVMEGLARWAYQFSPRISFDPLVLLLEISGSLRLFSGQDKLLERMHAELSELGYYYEWGIAPTPAGAGLLSRTRPSCEANDSASLHDLLQAVPLRRLTRDKAALTLIQQLGLYSIGDCLALPRAELARRVGPRLSEILDKVLGYCPDPRPGWQPPDTFQERLLLPAEINQITALAFPARRLLLSLCAYLRGRDAVTQQLHWTLIHRDAEPTRMEQGLLSSSQQPDHMLSLFREQLDRLQLPEPVVEMVLQVRHWELRRENTGVLFETGRTAADPALLERLQARMGAEAVSGVQVSADHRPEHAWRFCQPGETQPVDLVRHSGSQQPLWLLEQPRCLALLQGWPSYGGRLQLRPYPERIETGWWDGQDISRDYYLAVSPAGERLWIFRDRRAGQWYLHGFFE